MLHTILGLFDRVWYPTPQVHCLLERHSKLVQKYGSDLVNRPQLHASNLHLAFAEAFRCSLEHVA